MRNFLWSIALVFISSACWASGIYNPGAGSGGGSGNAFIKIVLQDSGGGLWSIVPNTSGNLVTTSIGATVAGTVNRTTFVLQDSSFNTWTISIDTTGHLVTTAGGSVNLAIRDLLINDSSNRTWIVTVSTAGNLVTS